MGLTIQTETRPNGFVVVRLDGRLDTETYPELESRMAPVLSSSAKVVLFDMANLSYISSMGLRTLFKARKAIEARKGKLIMSNLQPQIARVIEIANALPKTALFASVEEADRYFAAMQKAELEKQKGAG